MANNTADTNATEEALVAVGRFSSEADSVVDSWLQGAGSDEDDDNEQQEARAPRVGLGAKYLPHSKVAFTAEQKLRSKLKNQRRKTEEDESGEENKAEKRTEDPPDEDSRASMIRHSRKRVTPEHSESQNNAEKKKGKKRKRAEAKGAAVPNPEDKKLAAYEKQLVQFLVNEGGSCQMTNTKPCVGNDCPIPKGCGKLKKFVVKRPSLFKLADGVLTYVGPDVEGKRQSDEGAEEMGQKIERADEAEEGEEKERPEDEEEEPEEELQKAPKQKEERSWDGWQDNRPPKKKNNTGGRKKTRSRQKNLKKDSRPLSNRPTYLTPGAEDYHSNYVQARIGYERNGMRKGKFFVDDKAGGKAAAGE
eukprot:g775.t1